MAELGSRTAEVRESFAQEGMRHEQVHLLKTNDGLFLIYAMEAADHKHAAAASRNSVLPLDARHKQVMALIMGEPANAELLFDCVAAEENH